MLIIGVARNKIVSTTALGANGFPGDVTAYSFLDQTLTAGESVPTTPLVTPLSLTHQCAAAGGRLRQLCRSAVSFSR